MGSSDVGFGPVGGLLGDFSPIEVVYPAEIVMNFDVEPVDADKFQAIPVEVSVKGAEGTPWEGVVIRLEAFANNGQPMVVCGAEAVTDAQGVATFVNFAVGKVGGASIRATTVEPRPSAAETRISPPIRPPASKAKGTSTYGPAR